MLCASYFNRSFHISFHFNYTMLTSFMGAFPMAWQVKNPPVMQETHEMRVRSLGQEDPLKQEMATHSSILAWRTPWTEEPGGLQSIGLQRVRHDWTLTHTTSFIIQYWIQTDKKLHFKSTVYGTPWTMEYVSWDPTAVTFVDKPLRMPLNP